MQKPDKAAPLLPPVEPPSELAASVMAAVWAEPAPSWEKRQRYVTIAYFAVAMVAVCGAILWLLMVEPATVIAPAANLFQQLVVFTKLLVTGVLSIGRLVAYIFSLASSAAVVTGGILGVLTSLWRVALGPLLSITVGLGACTIIGQLALVRLLANRPVHAQTSKP